MPGTGIGSTGSTASRAAMARRKIINTANRRCAAKRDKRRSIAPKKCLPAPGTMNARGTISSARQNSMRISTLVQKYSAGISARGSAPSQVRELLFDPLRAGLYGIADPFEAPAIFALPALRREPHLLQAMPVQQAGRWIGRHGAQRS